MQTENRKVHTGRKKARLSVVVPCYNVEPYLRRCLDSLLAQTLEGVEIVCINDGSPDNCLSIMREYQKRYGSRIVVIDKKNEGVWKARKDGISAASGRYIGFLDPDDYVHPDFAKKLYAAAVREDADIACCGFYRIDMETGKAFSEEMTRFRYKSFDIRKDPGLMPEVNAALWNKIWRADVIRRMEKIGTIPKVLDDMVFAQLIYLHAGKIVFVKDAYVYYMVRRGSVINTIKRDSVPGVYAAMKEVRQVYEIQAPRMRDYLDAQAFLHLGISLMFRLSKEEDFRSILKANTAYLDREFPGWRNNPYMRASYVIRHKGANAKLWFVRGTYRMHLFPQFLTVYGIMIDRFKKDIKW